MANRSPSKSNVTNFEPMDKLTSSTLKRHPKMELSKTDLLKMLSYLEGELQGREIAIATLKAEKVKQLLYQAKYGKFGNDPFAALQRDSHGAYEKHFDENAIKGMYDNQLAQLENLISQHRNAQSKLKKQLVEKEEVHAKMLSELEDEKRKHAQDTAQGDDVTYLLEKERERLNKEIEFEKSQNRKMEKDLKKATQNLEQERQKQKQIVLLLLAERKRLMLRLLEERQRSEQLSMILNNEKSKIAEMVDGLEEESKKSLQMEAEMERQLSEFDTERGQLHHRLSMEETKSKQLIEENDRLRRELDTAREQLMLGNMVANPNIRVTQSGIAGAGLTPPRATPRPISPKPPNLSAPTTKPSIPPKVGAALQQRVALQNTNAASPSQQPPGVPPKTGAKAFKSPSPTPSQRVVGNVSPVTSEVASKVSVTPVVPQMATEPMSNRYNQQEGVPDIVSTHPPAAVNRVPPNPNTPQMAGGPPTRVYGTQQINKGPYQMNSTQQSPTGVPPVAPPKKQIPIGRGAPPPVPPNKPVLNQHQLMQKKESLSKGITNNRTEVDNISPTVEVNETRQSSSVESSVSSSVFMTQTISEHTASSAELVICNNSDQLQSTETSEINQLNSVDNACLSQNHSMDILGQEYVDFQQLLVSMVSGK